MQKRVGILLVAAAALLGGCEFKAKDEGAAVTQAEPPAGNVSVEKGLVVSTPEFQGKLNIPGMTLGGEDMDLDGMKLQPGSKVTGITVDAAGSAKDQVRIAFTSETAPQAVADHFRAQGKAAGFALAAPAGGFDVRGTKASGESFALTVAPAAAGATGTLILVDND